MRTYEKQCIKFGVITCVVTLFLLVGLPGLLVGIWNLGRDFQPYEDRQITLWRTASQRVEILPLEEYVMGVVASEMPSGFHPEALKAQAVAARTYGLAKIEKSKNGNPQAHPQAPLCDGTHCQVYGEIEEGEEGFQKVKEAVERTRGQVMYYQGEMVEQPLFHSASGGRTENSEDVFVAAVPYLRSVESGQYENGAYEEKTHGFSLDAFVRKVKSLDSNASEDPIAIVTRNEGGSVERMQVGKAVVTGREIRELLGLPSAKFEIQLVTDSSGGGQILFTTCGYGHGVGMSQYGADGMGKEGFDYVEILQHYYSGVEVR